MIFASAMRSSPPGVVLIARLLDKRLFIEAEWTPSKETKKKQS
jgi:hypothetical protein